MLKDRDLKKNLRSPELWRTVRVGVEIGNLIMMMAANSASWGGDRGVDDDDGGEQCELGWR